MSEEYTIRKLTSYTNYETAESLAATYKDIEECSEICGYYTNLFELPSAKRFSEIESLIRQNLFTANIPTNLQIRFFPKDKFYTSMLNAAMSGNLDFVRHFGKNMKQKHKDFYEDHAWICGHERIFPNMTWTKPKLRAFKFKNVDPRLLTKVIPELFRDMNTFAINIQLYSSLMLANNKLKELIEILPADILKDEAFQARIYRSLLTTGDDNFLTNPPEILNQIPNWSFDDFLTAVRVSVDFPFNLRTVSQVQFFQKEIEKVKDKDHQINTTSIDNLETWKALAEILGEDKIKKVLKIGRYIETPFASNVPLTEELKIRKYYSSFLDPKKHLAYKMYNCLGCTNTIDMARECYDEYLKRCGELTKEVRTYVDRYNRNLPEECRIVY